MVLGGGDDGDDGDDGGDGDVDGDDDDDDDGDGARPVANYDYANYHSCHHFCGESGYVKPSLPPE